MILVCFILHLVNLISFQYLFRIVLKIDFYFFFQECHNLQLYETKSARIKAATLQITKFIKASKRRAP